MKTGNILALAAIAVLIVQTDPASAKTHGPKKTLQVGIVLRLEDKFNDSVTALRSGIETAKDLFEESNPSTKISLKPYSHTEKLESVVASADRIATDKLPAVIGAEMSDETIVLGDRLAESGTVIISPTASNPRVTEGKPTVFRACFSDKQTAEKITEYLVAKLQPKTIGLIHNTSSSYTDYLSTKFLETFSSLTSKMNTQNRPILVERKVLKDQLNFDPEIDAFMQAGVTHVAMLTYQNDFARFALQAANKGFFPTYVGSDGWGSNENVYKKLVLESPHGAKFIALRNSYWREDLSNSLAKRFRVKFRAKYGKAPDAWSAIAFDASWLLFSAMNRAKDPSSPKQIAAELRGVKDLPLVTTSRFTFGPDNSPLKDLFIYRISKRGIQYEATLK